jgi:hypothetical protein
VPQPEMLLEHVFVKVTIYRRNGVNHESPHSSSMGSSVCEKRQARYWEISQYVG